MNCLLKLIIKKVNMENRTLGLIGEESLNKIKNAKVLLVGVGGVGGYVAEMLARTMIKKIIIVDGDKVEDSNRNRQLVALKSTLGQFKVDVLEKRLKDINPDLEIIKYNINFNEKTKDEIFLNDFDYVIDAIDSVKDKIILIKTSKENNKYIISSMGSGNRYKVQTYKIVDIYDTSYDKLAKKVRHELKKINIKSLDVCISTFQQDIISKNVFSISYNPAIMGCTIAGSLIEKIMKDN